MCDDIRGGCARMFKCNILFWWKKVRFWSVLTCDFFGEFVAQNMRQWNDVPLGQWRVCKTRTLRKKKTYRKNALIMFRKVERKRSEAVVIFSKGTCPWTFYTLKIIMIMINDNNANFKILQMSERSSHFRNRQSTLLLRTFMTSLSRSSTVGQKAKACVLWCVRVTWKYIFSFRINLFVKGVK